MSKRPPYVLPSDVLRLFDAQTASLSTAETDLVRDAIDDVSGEFEQDTGHAFRLTPVGHADAPSTLDFAGVEGSHRTPPIDVFLGHRFVRPFDSAEGDLLEYRSGRDSWEDITDGAGDDFTLYYESGKIRVYRWLIQQLHWEAKDDRYLRASYRYGAPGGRADQGGQTTLDGALNNSDTTVNVADASRLFAGRGVLIYGDNVEYVDVESIDTANDTITVSRGERSTSAASHSDGDTISYVPPGARRAFAGAAAVELQEYELFTDYLVDTGDGIGASDRVEAWNARWERLKARYSGVRKL